MPIAHTPSVTSPYTRTPAKPDRQHHGRARRSLGRRDRWPPWSRRVPAARCRPSPGAAGTAERLVWPPTATGPRREPHRSRRRTGRRCPGTRAHAAGRRCAAADTVPPDRARSLTPRRPSAATGATARLRSSVAVACVIHPDVPLRERISTRRFGFVAAQRGDDDGRIRRRASPDPGRAHGSSTARRVGAECVCHGRQRQFGVGGAGQHARVVDAVVTQPQTDPDRACFPTPGCRWSDP